MKTLKAYSTGLAQTLQQLPQALLIADQSLRIVYANDYAPEFFSRDKAALVGETLLQLIDTKHRRELRKAAMAVLESTNTVHQKSLFTAIQKPDRTVQFTHVTFAPVVKNSGETHLYVRFDRTTYDTRTTMDVQDQLNMASLSTSAIQALDMLEDAIIIYDPEWRFQFLNKAAWKLLSLDKNAVLGKVAWEIYPELINSELYTAAIRSMKLQTQTMIEEYYPLVRNWYRIKFYPSPSSLITQLQDINDMVEARNINRQLLGTLDQAMSVYWSDANHPRRKPKDTSDNPGTNVK